jgi:hypothetical protein
VEEVVRAKGLSGRTAERSGLPNTTDKNKHPQKDIHTIYILIFASIERSLTLPKLLAQSTTCSSKAS